MCMALQRPRQFRNISSADTSHTYVLVGALSWGAWVIEDLRRWYTTCIVDEVTYSAAGSGSCSIVDVRDVSWISPFARPGYSHVALFFCLLCLVGRGHVIISLTWSVCDLTLKLLYSTVELMYMSDAQTWSQKYFFWILYKFLKCSGRRQVQTSC